MIHKDILKKIKKPSQKYILRTNKKWFNHYAEYVESGRVLHVGNGLGYASMLIKEKNINVISLDIEIQEDTINKDEVILYDGNKIPFADNIFDVLVCDYVLHHTKNPGLFLNELIRVTKESGLLVIIDQTYSNFFQKLKLVYSCWKQNRAADQKVEIYWKSYFSRHGLRSMFREHHLDILDTISEQRKSSYTEMFILKKVANPSEVGHMC